MICPIHVSAFAQAMSGDERDYDPFAPNPFEIVEIDLEENHTCMETPAKRQLTQAPSVPEVAGTEIPNGLVTDERTVKAKYESLVAGSAPPWPPPKPPPPQNVPVATAAKTASPAAPAAPWRMRGTPCPDVFGSTICTAYGQQIARTTAGGQIGGDGRPELVPRFYKIHGVWVDLCTLLGQRALQMASENTQEAAAPGNTPFLDRMVRNSCDEHGPNPEMARAIIEMIRLITR